MYKASSEVLARRAILDGTGWTLINVFDRVNLSCNTHAGERLTWDHLKEQYGLPRTFEEVKREKETITLQAWRLNGLVCDYGHSQSKILGSLSLSAGP